METNDVEEILEMLLEGQLILRKAPKVVDTRDDLHVYEVAALKRNIKWKGVPTVLENKLTALYKEGNEGYLNERMEPYSIVEMCGDLDSSKVPLDVSPPELVIADLTASPDWDQSSFERLFTVLFSLFY
ncbi:hypothetical protein R1sor_006653 [Riccia sorocarpa]|uniref:Uncharacterized protein n=1 Tax=Riccia sorocarpa TaxID=122646 RepID=A0ABD3HN72_9MARC